MYFPGNAYFFRERFHPIGTGDHNCLGLTNFYFIPRVAGEEDEFLLSMIRTRENLARRRPELRSFITSHLPIASDGSGNDFWIELSSGRVKFRVLEGFEDERDLVDSAPSFLELASNLEAKRRPAAGKS